MTYYVATTLAKAQTWAAHVDTAAGYPKPGVDVGGGIHVPPAQSVTTGYADILQHPTLAQWAYPADGTVVGYVGPNAITLGLPAPVALDATWFPASGPTATAVGN